MTRRAARAGWAGGGELTHFLSLTPTRPAEPVSYSARLGLRLSHCVSPILIAPLYLPDSSEFHALVTFP
jgi:hypothetical protein